jgi:hypothetical protein
VGQTTVHVTGAVNVDECLVELRENQTLRIVGCAGGVFGGDGTIDGEPNWPTRDSTRYGALRGWVEG